MNSGLCPALMELKPRMRMEGVSPAAPEVVLICTPATFPYRAEVTAVTCDLASSSAFTTFAEPVKDSLVEVPKATTMVSSSIWASSWRTTSMTARPSTGMACSA